MIKCIFELSPFALPGATVTRDKCLRGIVAKAGKITTFLQSGYGGGENFSATASALFPYAKRSTAYRYALAIEKSQRVKREAVRLMFF